MHYSTYSLRWPQPSIALAFNSSSTLVFPNAYIFMYTVEMNLRHKG